LKVKSFLTLSFVVILENTPTTFTDHLLVWISSYTFLQTMKGTWSILIPFSLLLIYYYLRVFKFLLHFVLNSPFSLLFMYQISFSCLVLLIKLRLFLFLILCTISNH
jgi:hypothetical protein